MRLVSTSSIKTLVGMLTPLTQIDGEKYFMEVHGVVEGKRVITAFTTFTKMAEYTHHYSKERFFFTRIDLETEAEFKRLHEQEEVTIMVDPELEIETDTITFIRVTWK